MIQIDNCNNISFQYCLLKNDILNLCFEHYTKENCKNHGMLNY